MRILKPLQTGVLQRSFTFTGRHFLCASLLWSFRLDDATPVLEPDMWRALSGFLSEGRIFDQGMPKDRAEFLCAGSFHAADGQPVRQAAVSVRVGSLEKRLLISGPRWWRAGGPSRAEAITQMPIRYSEAFGGGSFPDNPSGKGYAPDTADDGGRPLPCVEYPHEAVTSPTQTPPPASLEGLDIGWRPRQKYAGTYDEEYLRTRMPGLADDVDWRVFNDAAPDQWFEGFLRGDEPFEIVNMHPENARLRGALPGVFGRAFIDRKLHPGDKNSEVEFREIPLRLDTVWLLPEAGLGVLIHRGTTEVAEDDASDIVRLLAAHENVSDEPRSRDHYQNEMRKRGDPDNGFRYMLDTRPLLPVGVTCAIQELAASDPRERENLVSDNMRAYTENQAGEAGDAVDQHIEGVREQLGDGAKDLPDDTRDSLDRSLDETTKAAAPGGEGGGDANGAGQMAEIERIVEKMLPGSTTGGDLDLTKVDFDAFNDLRQHMEAMAVEHEEDARRMLRERLEELKAQNDPPTEQLTQTIADTEAALAAGGEPSPLPRPDLDVNVEQLREQVQSLEQYREELAAGGVDVDTIDAAIPDLEPIRQQLAEAHAAMRERYKDWAHLQGEASSPHPGEEPDRRNAILAAMRENRSAAGGDYAFVDLSGVTLRGLDLSDALLEYVDLTNATLIDVNLSGAVLARAELKACRFENVLLHNANIGSTTIHNAEFHNCDFSEARFGRAEIVDTTFDHCRFEQRMEMFMETTVERVRFTDCIMPGLNFVDIDMVGCEFRGSDLTQSNFLQADLTRCDFSGSTLAGVNIVSTRAAGARFDDAVMSNVRFIDEPVLNDCSFRGATMEMANLRGADLAGAVFTRAVLDGAELTDADLTDVRFDRCSAIGAQLRNTNLRGAVLEKADLREASLMKAKLVRSVLAGANLYSVSFLNATLGETEFGGANLDNTILRDWRPRGG